MIQLPENMSELKKFPELSILNIDTSLKLLKMETNELFENGLETLLYFCHLMSSSPSDYIDYIDHLNSLKSELLASYNELDHDHLLRPDLADVLSFALSVESNSLESFYYKMQGRDLGCKKWGSSYIFTLSEQAELYFKDILNNPTNEEPNPRFMSICYEITSNLMAFGMENEATDFCLELGMPYLMKDYITKENVLNICAYMERCSVWTSKNNFYEINSFVADTYYKFDHLVDGFRTSCRYYDYSRVYREILFNPYAFNSSTNLDNTEEVLRQLQMCFILHHFGQLLGFHQEVSEKKENTLELFRFFLRIPNLRNALQSIANKHNKACVYKLSSIWELTEKQEDEFYNKCHEFVDPKLFMDSIYSSALANAGLQNDGVLDGYVNFKWLKTKTQHVITHSLLCRGLLCLWDIDRAIRLFQDFCSNKRPKFNHGVILALGIATSGVFDENRLIFQMFVSILNKCSKATQEHATAALGIAYAGTSDLKAMEFLTKQFCKLNTGRNKMITAFAHGIIGCSTNKVYYKEQDQYMRAMYTHTPPLRLVNAYQRFYPLGVALLFVGKHLPIPVKFLDINYSDPAYKVWSTMLLYMCSNIGTADPPLIQLFKDFCVPDPDVKSVEMFEKLADMGKNHFHNAYTDDPSESTTLDSSSYAEIFGDNVKSSKRRSNSSSEVAKPNTGSFEDISESMSDSEEPYTNAIHLFNGEAHLIQGLATIAIAFICMGNEKMQKIGLDSYKSLLGTTVVSVRQTIPIGLGILFASEPHSHVIKILRKLCNDEDVIVATNAIMALGMMGAGTENLSIGTILKNISTIKLEHSRKQFAVRFSKAMLCLGRGLITISPKRAGGLHLSPISVSSLIIYGLLSLSANYHPLIYHRQQDIMWLVPAMRPKAVVIYHSDYSEVKPKIRIGKVNETIFNREEPSLVSDHKLSDAPETLLPEEYAELIGIEYSAFSKFLEGITILRNKNSNDSNT